MTPLRLLPRREFVHGLVLSIGAVLGTRCGLAIQAARAHPCEAGPASTPWTEFGINIVGPALGQSVRGKYGRDYIYPDENSLAYYRSKGFKVARVTFLWERLQPKLFSELDPDETKRLQGLIEMVRKQNMVLITGPHNYARYAVNDGEAKLIGSSEVPTSAFVDFWRRLAALLVPVEDGLVFSLMNEPHDTGGSWPSIAQAAVDAIRESDRTRWIYVPGDGWSSARSWRQFNEGLAISDPSDRVVYVAHQYFDGSGKGVYEKRYDEDGAYPEIGVDRVKPFLQWLDQHGFRGTMTEYGVPNSDPRWLVVLANTLDALRRAKVGGAYWAGGPWWGDYPLSSEPHNGQDAPVMSVLATYAKGCSTAQSE